jgi:hypothetical protein
MYFLIELKIEILGEKFKMKFIFGVIVTNWPSSTGMPV